MIVDRHAHVFAHEGEDYAVQYMPVGMQEQSAPPELMLAQMMNAGVDHCVLQAGDGYGAMTEMNAFAERQYPARMTGLCMSTRRWRASPGSLPRSIMRSMNLDCAVSTSVSMR